MHHNYIRQSLIAESTTPFPYSSSKSCTPAAVFDVPKLIVTGVGSTSGSLSFSCFMEYHIPDDTVRSIWTLPSPASLSAYAFNKYSFAFPYSPSCFQTILLCGSSCCTVRLTFRSLSGTGCLLVFMFIIQVIFRLVFFIFYVLYEIWQRHGMLFCLFSGIMESLYQILILFFCYTYKIILPIIIQFSFHWFRYLPILKAFHISWNRYNVSLGVH